MRKVLEDFYYGNIIPCEKRIAANSSLQCAASDAARCESQLAEVLSEKDRTLLTDLVQAQQETAGLDVGRSEDYTVVSWLRSWHELYAKPNVRPATADRYQLIIETYTIPRIGKIKLNKRPPETCKSSTRT